MQHALLSQLRNTSAAAELRKVPEDARADRSEANTALMGPDVRDDEAERWRYFFNSGVANWFDEIKDVTFSSSFCVMERSEAKIIVDHWEKREREIARLIREKDPLLKETCTGHQHPILDELLHIATESLAHLRDRLNVAIQREVKKSSVGRAFVKLSTRSPKDSKKALGRAKVAYEERIQQMKKLGKDTSPNERWKVLSEEVTRAGSCATAAEAIELCLDSARVYEDLEYALRGPPAEVDSSNDGENGGEEKISAKTGEVELCWSMSLVARAWDPRLTPQSEFRGIVWEGQLTCLCQYFHPLYFPELKAKKDLILHDVMATFNRADVSKSVQNLGGNCIVDFAWLQEGQVLIVELNPFDGVCLGTFPASTGLFLWDDEDGDRLVMKGDAPFEFRIREAPLASSELKNQCNPAWRDIVYASGKAQDT